MLDAGCWMLDPPPAPQPEFEIRNSKCDDPLAFGAKRACQGGRAGYHLVR